jgi:hypothetical protein
MLTFRLILGDDSHVWQTVTARSGLEEILQEVSRSCKDFNVLAKRQRGGAQYLLVSAYLRR